MVFLDLVKLSCLEPGKPLLEPSVSLYREKEAEGFANSKTEIKKLIYLCSFKLDNNIKSSLGRLPPNLNTLYNELYELLSTKLVLIDLELGSSIKVLLKDLVLKIYNNFIIFDS
ncbi:hypothetical protein GGP41_008395 [Bipolaris sorokiniana]|uniref:Uncharacterized protein n=1 Tax=Cochliobolus sativus TaxID=45130 RepID=A0A8H5ZDM4_COCSA|nr:hypothetical protein GGP41_008395 [Bipolaris sorokiniana]